MAYPGLYKALTDGCVIFHASSGISRFAMRTCGCGQDACGGRISTNGTGTDESARHQRVIVPLPAVRRNHISCSYTSPAVEDALTYPCRIRFAGLIIITARQHHRTISPVYCADRQTSSCQQTPRLRHRPSCGSDRHAAPDVFCRQLRPACSPGSTGDQAARPRPSTIPHQCDSRIPLPPDRPPATFISISVRDWVQCSRLHQSRIRRQRFAIQHNLRIHCAIRRSIPSASSSGSRSSATIRRSAAAISIYLLQQRQETIASNRRA